MTSYVYRQLDSTAPHIRILDLMPATTEEADIHCKLQELPLSQCQATDCSYEALSYVWGSPERPNYVCVDGDLLPITSNLDTALRHLRHQSQNRRLWVDAICINQANEEEKGVQVLLMRRIYAEASRVLVWLGPGDGDTDNAIAFLAREAGNPKGMLSDKEALRPILPGFTKIFTSPWWSRMWVYQEVVVASRCPLVICGHSQITWTDLNQEEVRWNLMLEFIEETPDIRDIHIRGSQEFADIPTSYSDHSPEDRRESARLFAILWATCHRNASDARDKVFAVLGLVTDGSADSVQPDYSKSVSQVYQTATLSILNSEDKFDILHRIHTASRCTDLPTWCPDFSTGEWGSFERGDRFFPLLDTSDFGADRGMAKELVTHTASSGSITLPGVEVGRIATARPSSFTSDVISYYRSLIENGASASAVAHASSRLGLEWSEIAGEIHRVLAKTVGIDEANQRLAEGETWRIINAGKPLYQHADFKSGAQLKIDKSEFRDGYWLFEKDLQDRQAGLYGGSNMTPWSDLVSNSNAQNLRGWAMSYLLKMPETLEDTSFFITENDRYGISARRIEEGDILCVLFGCRLPVVLRPQNDKYNLVSFAYVPAIMQGELFKDKAQAESNKKMFEIT